MNYTKYLMNSDNCYDNLIEYDTSTVYTWHK